MKKSPQLFLGHETYTNDTQLLSPQVRDDNKRQHPCLVDFTKLPETERNYNVQMSSETLK